MTSTPPSPPASPSSPAPPAASPPPPPPLSLSQPPPAFLLSLPPHCSHLASRYLSLLPLPPPHHRSNVSSLLCSLLADATISLLGTSPAPLPPVTPKSLLDDAPGAYPQAGLHARLRGLAVGFLESAELAPTPLSLEPPPPPKPDGTPPDETRASEAPPDEAGGPPATPLSSLSASFRLALSSPSPLKFLASSSAPPPPEHRQLDKGDLAERLEAYFLALYLFLSPDPPPPALRKRLLSQHTKHLLASFSFSLPSSPSPPLLLTSLLTSLSRSLLLLPTLSPAVEHLVSLTVSRTLHSLSPPAAPPSTLRGLLHQQNITLSAWSDPALSLAALLPHARAFVRHASPGSPDHAVLLRSCLTERLLSRGLPPPERAELQGASFASPGEARAAYRRGRAALRNIRLPPSSHLPALGGGAAAGAGAAQAMADLKRERLFVNGREVVGRVLASRRELVAVLTEAIEQGAVSSVPVNKRGGKGEEAAGGYSSGGSLASGEGSGAASDSDSAAAGSEGESSRNRPPRIARRRRFDMSAIEAIVGRVLLACSRTHSGGDMYFAVDDLFGGEGVSLRPVAAVGGDVSCIEISVYLGRIDVVTRAFWEVWPGDAAEGAGPLLVVGGKMRESVELALVRKEGAVGGEASFVLREKEGGGEGEEVEFGRRLKLVIM
ncbi:hypothetical protein TeGR_g4753 [Tetraparma gracilis]|uniref:Uncharacterized protein n=1 Tax=Tetraparma gracilis TaxID=2962635 RepID=A0ABQ6MU08_9STRA|nr:hypothetical protein TeGR_g4753 [Tetraparma gracilis]